MTRVSRIAKDFVGLVSVCGALTALAWLAYAVLRASAVVRRGDLQPADRALGDGPFRVRIRKHHCSFRVAGPGVVSGIREIYVREAYLRDGWIGITRNSVVMDLGANIGNFTNLALAMDPTVRVVAVEPSRDLNQRFLTSVGLNEGFLDRAQLIRAFVGTQSDKVARATASDPAYAGVDWLGEEELIRRAGVSRVDFLKCDIEGGEFGLIEGPSPLLSMTQAIACEVHAFAGDVNSFLRAIASQGFTIGPTQWDRDGSVTFVAKRMAQQV